MKTKLTLSIDKDLVEFAHSQANTEKRSISGIFSDFLIAQRVQVNHKKIARVTEMTGTLKDYPVNDSKPAIRSAYAKKYLRRS